MAYVDVYVDDLVGLEQRRVGQELRVNRAILHALDKVFRPLEQDDLEWREEPASLSKFAKGEGYPATRKIILGWLIDSVAMTIQLTARRRQRLDDILADLPRTRTRVSVQKWQQVLGELRSMAVALPGSRGLFSALQFRFKADAKRIRLTRMVHDFLDDFRWIADDLAHRPTRIYEVIPSNPRVVGATDASGLGMGGVFFVPLEEGTSAEPLYESYLWRYQYADDIRTHLVSFTNPDGSITNSDLELTATIAQNDVIAHAIDIRETTIGNVHDNSPTVFWNRKGSATTDGPAAYLLRLQALHQRAHKYISLHDFIPGHLNRMADDTSRRWDLSDDQLLNYFDSFFPQARPWKLCTLRPEMSSSLISGLHKRRSDPASWKSELEPQMNIGAAGWPFVKKSPWILGSPKGTTLYRTYRCSPNDSVMDASHPAANPFDLLQLLTSYEVSGRATPGWGPRTSARTDLATPTSA